MCDECGCSVSKAEHSHEQVSTHATSNQKTVEVFTRILDANDQQAQANREHFDKHGILAVNLMSSPGAGKTTLLEKTIEVLATTPANTLKNYKIGVIEADLETETDADRIKAKGVPAFQITTGQACHINAAMVHRGIHHLPLAELDIVFIENVGNLVCPASYDIGAHLDVVLLSVPEGDDKPAKYPVMFRAANLAIISKIDLKAHLQFDIEKVVKETRKLNPKADILQLSAVSGQGMAHWCEYLSLKVCLRKNCTAESQHA